MPRVRITEDTLWYDRSYHRGEEVVVEGREYLDLLMAGRLDAAGLPGLPPRRLLPANEIEGKHRGELVFVLGNGPSIRLGEGCVDRLEQMTTIGINRAFLFMKSTYLLFLDAPFWVRESEQILGCGSEVFCPKKLHLPYFTGFGRYNARNKQDVLSPRWADGLFWSRTSTAAGINLAYLFGASDIALLGVDLRDSSHFYSDEGRGRPFLHADEILEDLLWMSRRLREEGVKVWNCSKESDVRGFDEIELPLLLEGREG